MSEARRKRHLCSVLLGGACIGGILGALFAPFGRGYVIATMIVVLVSVVAVAPPYTEVYTDD